MSQARDMKKVVKKFKDPVDIFLTHYENAQKYAKANCKREDEVGNLARAFLGHHHDMKLIDNCLQKAHMWLERAMG